MNDGIVDGIPDPPAPEGWLVEPAPPDAAARAVAAQPFDAAHAAAGAVTVDVSVTTDPHHDSGSPGSGYHEPAPSPTGGVHAVETEEHADGSEHSEAADAEATAEHATEAHTEADAGHDAAADATPDHHAGDTGADADHAGA